MGRNTERAIRLGFLQQLGKTVRTRLFLLLNVFKTWYFNRAALLKSYSSDIFSPETAGQ